MKARTRLVSFVGFGLVSLAACSKSQQAAPAAAAPAAPAAAAAPAGELKPAAATQAVAPSTPPAASSGEDAGKLKVKVFTASPEGFLVNATLVSGDKDAVLIDAQFQLSDAKHLAEQIKETKKHLTTIYVTHWHPDHYFGAGVLKEAFPDAKVVALPATVHEIKKTWEAKVKQWQPIFKENIPAKPLIPEPLTGTVLTVEGKSLEITGKVQGDSEDNSFVYIPTLKTVITGDIVYDGVYPWTAETTPAQRKAWAGTLDKIAELKPETVVPGHQKPDAADKPASLQFMKDYLAAYDEAISSSKTAADAQSKVKAKYNDLALDIILKIGTDAAYKKHPEHAGTTKKPEQPAKK